MKNYVCPACGKKYTFWEYQKKFWGQEEKWHCEKCNTLLAFHKGRHKILLIMTLFPFPFISTAAHELMESGMGAFLSIFISSMVFLIW